MMLANEPGAHDRQADWPVAPVAVPSGHGEHKDDCGRPAYVPGEQAVQAVAPVEFMYEPDEHDRHVDLPTSGLNMAAGQAEHTDEPGTDWNEPIGHE